jgi:hypothetical protein
MLLAASVTAAGMFLAGCRAEKVAAPTSYASFAADDKSFQCIYPTGWKAVGSSSQGIRSGAVFSKGSAKIDVDADLQGSLMGDIARSANSMVGSVAPGLAGRTRPPVETLHDINKKAVSENYKDYREFPTKPFRSALGEARITEFTGTHGGLFKSKIHGYRATILGGERQVTVLTRCAEDDWKTLQMAFLKVIMSLK